MSASTSAQDPDFAHARALLDQGDAPGAIKRIGDVIKRLPDSVDARILLGQAHLALGELGDAQAAFEEALALDDASTPARFRLAETLVRKGDVVRASSQLHVVLKHAPGFGPAYVVRGDLALHHGDHRQAAVEYCRGIELDAADAPVYERLGRAFEAIADPAQAVKAFDGAIALDPACRAAYVGAARVCEAQGWLNRARRYYDALGLFEDHAAIAAAGRQRVLDGIRRSGLEGIDPPGAPPEKTELRGFVPPRTHDATPRGPSGTIAPGGRPGSRVGRPLPPLADLLASAAPDAVGPGTDGFGASTSAAGYLAAFREPPPDDPLATPPPSAADAFGDANEASAAGRDAASAAAGEGEPQPPDVMQTLDALQARLRDLLK